MSLAVLVPDNAFKAREDKGSGCGSVGRAVATDTKGLNPLIEKIYIDQRLLSNVLKRRKIKKKCQELSHLKRLLKRCSMSF